MAIDVIGKSVLGNLGFCQSPQKMGDEFYSQLDKIYSRLPEKSLLMTSMTGVKEVKATNGEYFPKIRMYDSELADMFSPEEIYLNCEDGLDPLRPGADFIVWDSYIAEYASVATFSREAPILYFESTTKRYALGVILRPSLMKYGEYLFNTIKEALQGDITCYLVTCNHYEYDRGSIPSVVEKLAHDNGMLYYCMFDSESYEECYHRGETGNHVVVINFPKI